MIKWSLYKVILCMLILKLSTSDGWKNGGYSNISAQFPYAANIPPGLSPTANSNSAPPYPYSFSSSGPFGLNAPFNGRVATPSKTEPPTYPTGYSAQGNALNSQGHDFEISPQNYNQPLRTSTTQGPIPFDQYRWGFPIEENRESPSLPNTQSDTSSEPEVPTKTIPDTKQMNSMIPSELPVGPSNIQDTAQNDRPKQSPDSVTNLSRPVLGSIQSLSSDNGGTIENSINNEPTTPANNGDFMNGNVYSQHGKFLPFGSQNPQNTGLDNKITAQTNRPYGLMNKPYGVSKDTNIDSNNYEFSSQTVPKPFFKPLPPNVNSQGMSYNEPNNMAVNRDINDDENNSLNTERTNNGCSSPGTIPVPNTQPEYLTLLEYLLLNPSGNTPKSNLGSPQHHPVGGFALPPVPATEIFTFGEPSASAVKPVSVMINDPTLDGTKSAEITPHFLNIPFESMMSEHSLPKAIPPNSDSQFDDAIEKALYSNTQSLTTDEGNPLMFQTIYYQAPTVAHSVSYTPTKDLNVPDDGSQPPPITLMEITTSKAHIVSYGTACSIGPPGCTVYIQPSAPNGETDTVGVQPPCVCENTSKVLPKSYYP